MKDNSARKVVLNFAYNLVFQVFRMILPLITIPYVSRILGAENLGIYNYTYSVATYFAMIGYLGFENYGNRLIAQNKNNQDDLNRAFSGAYAFQIVSGLTAVALYAVYMILFCRDNITIAWIQILYVSSEIFNISWFYFGIEKFKKPTIVNVVIRLLSFVCILCFVKTPKDLSTYTFICAATFLLSTVLLWPATKKYVRWCSISFKEVIFHGKGTLILFFPVLVISIYRSMDKIMLGNMATMVDVALYSNADKIVEVPYGVITALGVVMIPRMTDLVSKGQKKITFRYIELSMRFMMFLACGMCFGMLGVGKVFAPVFFGEEFIQSGSLIMIIAPMVIVRACANVVRTQYLLPNRRDKDYIVSILIGVVVNLVFNSLLIPKWTSAGAAIATLMAESFVAFYQIFVCRKDIPVVKYIFRNWFFAVSGIIMFIPVYRFGASHNISTITLIEQILIGIIVYLTIAGTYLIVNEKVLVVKVLNRK